MNKTTVTISDGYKIFEEKSLYDLENILKVLKEDNLTNIISAVIKEEKVEVVKKYWFCPVCGCKHYIKRKIQFLPTASKMKFSVLICFILLMF